MSLGKIFNLDNNLVIDWQMTPEYTFGTFESWGGVERVRNASERIYYFFIDAWSEDEEPKLCLMERGVKHARIVGEIKAPQDMINRCVSEHGKVAKFEKTMAINKDIEEWLKKNLLEPEDGSLVILYENEAEYKLADSGLPSLEDDVPPLQKVGLPSAGGELSEESLLALIKEYNLVDHERNPQGDFNNYFVDTGDGSTVVDMAVGLMWQRAGADIMSFRAMEKELARINEEKFGGYDDWRIPGMAEALSLMERDEQDGLFIHKCFSRQQPFIFVNSIRKPGGYWFVDFKHGRAFWASGTIPGGFGRFCRSWNKN